MKRAHENKQVFITQKQRRKVKRNALQVFIHKKRKCNNQAVASNNKAKENTGKATTAAYATHGQLTLISTLTDKASQHTHSPNNPRKKKEKKEPPLLDRGQSRWLGPSRGKMGARLGARTNSVV